MSKSFNKVFLMGNVGKDPEVYNLSTGMLVRLTLATDELSPDGRGGWIENTEWHDLVARGRTAQILRDYVRKGSKIFIEGKKVLLVRDPRDARSLWSRLAAPGPSRSRGNLLVGSTAVAANVKASGASRKPVMAVVNLPTRR